MLANFSSDDFQKFRFAGRLIIFLAGSVDIVKLHWFSCSGTLEHERII
jgi:hypothetical protein